MYHSDAFLSPQPTTTPSFLRAVADDFAENKGDARGAALLLEDVSVFRGPNEILNKISWRVEPNTKWAVRVAWMLSVWTKFTFSYSSYSPPIPTFRSLWVKMAQENPLY